MSRFKQAGLLLLAGSLLTTTVTQPAHPNWRATFYTEANEPDLVAIGICTCGVGLLVAGAYALYQYLHVSNEQLVDDTNLLIDRAQQYQALITILNNYQISDERAMSEVVLYELAQQLGPKVALRRYIDNLAQLQQALDKQVRKLNQRRHKLVQKYTNNNGSYAGNVEVQQLIDMMLTIDLAAQPLLRELGLLLRCLNSHYGYFTLFQIYSNFSQKYQLELTVLQQNGGIDHLKRLARGSVAAEHVLYPLIQYTRLLKSDLEDLARAQSKLSENCPGILGYSQGLSANLDQLYRLLAGDPDYTAEQNVRREAEQREAKLQLERQRISIEMQRLAAEQQRLRECRQTTHTVIVHH
ncbi:MAG TPA: hypothetical protein VJJ83_01505 [Candidatus Babeliales bacterium]|nr:hypothetical protein [Candidatus Babeliales bacterium]